MGLDVGKKRIGVAVSDELGITAQPLKHINRASIDKDMEEILSVADDYAVEKIIVGVPYNMDGSVGPQARAAVKFMEALREKTGKYVEGWDERLSTVAVERVLIEGDVSRGKRKGVVDKLAAAYILQGWLERRSCREPARPAGGPSRTAGE